MRAEGPTDESDVTQDQINLVVGKLCQITRESTLDYAIRVGSVVIHYFYAGDMRTWRSRGPKMQSFRRLASHPQLPMSASALYRCVAIFELCERLNVVSRWPRITVSHLKLVLSFDEQEQCRLISRANSERWSVQRLQEEAHNAHTVASNGARRGGRSSSPEVVRIARHVEKLVHSSSWVLDRLPHVAQPLDGRYTQVEERIHQAIRCLEEARDVLESLRPNQTSLRSGTERQPAESGVQPAASGLGA